MDAQQFMYYAFGGGFLLLVLFVCIAIIYLIRILKDVSETSHAVKDTALKVNDNVVKIADKVTSATEQITDYVVKPFTLIQFIVDKAQPLIEMLQSRYGDSIPKANIVEEEEEAPKKKRRFGRKK